MVSTDDPPSNDLTEQAVVNKEADRRLLAAFINGLTGVPGRQIRLQMPDTIDKALNMAIVAMNADREDRASREDREANRQVFAVGGNREDTPFGRRDKLGGNSNRVGIEVTTATVG